MLLFATMDQPTRRIVLAFRLLGEPGRRKITSLLKCIREQELGWQLYILRNHEDFSAEFVESLPRRKIDGIVYSMPEAKSGAAALARLDIPTVAVDIYDERLLHGRRRNLVYIRDSSDAVGRAAARNLTSQGCFRSYGYVADLMGNAWGRLRGDAFVDELKRRGLEVSRYRARGKGYDLPALAKWLCGLPKPVGVFAAHDDRAIQVIEVCHEAGLAIPGDVAVLGVDNDEMICMSSTPPMSSVQPDHEGIGRLAVESLKEMMDGRRLARPVRRLVDIREIVIRESTSAVSNAGQLVQKALAFIRTHAAEAIKPRDVAAYLKVSRSLADLRFRELQGESIGKAILRQRLEEVCRRLLTTNETIENIAARCQFKRVYRLRDAFKAAYGCTMQDWRDSARG